MAELINHIDYAKFFNEVLQFDFRIRFVAVYDGKLKAKFREGINDQFKEAEIKSSFSEALKIRKYRNQESFSKREPKFAMSHYEGINQILIPLNNGEIVLVTTERDVEIHNLVNKIIELRGKLST